MESSIIRLVIFFGVLYFIYVIRLIKDFKRYFFDSKVYISQINKCTFWDFLNYRDSNTTFDTTMNFITVAILCCSIAYWIFRPLF